MGFLLGIDGGGTKTECVLADESGAVVARTVGDGANLRRTSAAELRETLSQCLEALRQQAGLARLECDAVCGGFAGAGQAEARLEAEEALRKLLRPKLLVVVGDMEVALEAAVGAGPGVVLIAGTGSIAFGRNATGKTARAGGEGPKFSHSGRMVGDIGSAAYFAWRFLEATRTARGQDFESSEMFKPICEAMGIQTKSDFQRATQFGFGVGSDVAPMILSAAQQGDKLALEIVGDAADGLSALAIRVLRELDFDDDESLVALGGGLFNGSELLSETVAQKIRAAAPRARVEPLAVSPAEGAVRMAQRLWLEEQGSGSRTGERGG